MTDEYRFMAQLAKVTALTGGYIPPALERTTVGNDWDKAVARTLGSGQALFSQWLDTVRASNLIESTVSASDTPWIEPPDFRASFRA